MKRGWKIFWTACIIALCAGILLVLAAAALGVSPSDVARRYPHGIIWSHHQEDFEDNLEDRLEDWLEHHKGWDDDFDDDDDYEDDLEDDLDDIEDDLDDILEDVPDHD